MKLNDSSEHLLFPTPIWEYRFEDCEEFNAKLAEDIHAFDWAAHKQENALEFGDDLTSRNEDTFIPLDRAVGIMHILQLAIEKATLAAQRFGWNLETHQLQLGLYWANVNAPFDYNMRHDHVPSHLSGVYYVRVPPNSGNIRFFDDRRVKTITEPEAKQLTDLSQDTMTFEPKEGTLLLFPSWLEHIVGQNKSDETRISISFNLDLVEKPD